MGKRKRKLSAAEKAEKKRRRSEFMTIFVGGKQQRVKRPQLIEGMTVEDFIRANADPIWLHQNEMWEELYGEEQGVETDVDRATGELRPHVWRWATPAGNPTAPIWRLPLRHPASARGSFGSEDFPNCKRERMTGSRFAGWTCRCAHSVAGAPSIAPRHVGKRISLSAIRAFGSIRAEQISLE